MVMIEDENTLPENDERSTEKGDHLHLYVHFWWSSTWFTSALAAIMLPPSITAELGGSALVDVPMDNAVSGDNDRESESEDVSGEDDEDIYEDEGPKNNYR
jgi:hypothetical protein